jgi:hypothetical protein
MTPTRESGLRRAERDEEQGSPAGANRDVIAPRGEQR